MCTVSQQQPDESGCAPTMRLLVVCGGGHWDETWPGPVLQKEPGERGCAGAGGPHAASGAKEEARGKAGVGAGTRAGAGDEDTGGILALMGSCIKSLFISIM